MIKTTVIANAESYNNCQDRLQEEDYKHDTGATDSTTLYYLTIRRSVFCLAPSPAQSEVARGL